MRKVTRTPYGFRVQTALLLGKAHEVEENSTINQVLKDSSVVPFQPTNQTMGMETAESYDYTQDSANLRLHYLCIGQGAHFNVNAASGGIPYTDYYAHEAGDSGLFRMIPFVVRLVSNDLTVSQRANYRLRKILNINNVLYAAYYCRKLNLDNVQIEAILTTVANGVEVSTPFVPTINNLKPTPRQVTGSTDGSYISVIAPTVLEFNAQEITWFKEGCELLYGNSNSAIISEFAFCTGVDKPITKRYSTDGNGTPSAVTDGVLKEAMAVQVAVHVTDHAPFTSSDNLYALSIDIGTTEPLYGVRV